MDENTWKRGMRYAGMLLMAGCTLLLELTLTRILSVALWYHFAFLVVAIALLGVAAGGVTVGLWPRRFTPRVLPLIAVGAGVSACAAITVFLRFGDFLRLLFPLLGPASLEPLMVAAAPLIFLPPFFLAGLGVSALLAHWPGDASRLYASDLLGAGLACLVFAPLMEQLGGPRVVIASGLVACLAGVPLSIAAGRARLAVPAGAVAAAVLASVLLLPSRSLALPYVKGIAEVAEPLFEAWNSFSRILVFPAQGPDSLAVTIDANASTFIVRAGSVDRDSWRTDIRGLPYILRRGGHALIIGPGGGSDITAALALGQRRVTAVEINPLIVMAASEIFGQFSGRPYQQPGVTAVIDDGRSFIARSMERYDVIVLTFVDTWAATAAGAFSLTENNLYTREAIRIYLEHLADDGVFVASRWYKENYPPEMVRLAVLVRAALEDLGFAQPYRHVAILRTGELGILYATKRPFTQEELAVLRNSGVDVVYLPDQPAEPFDSALRLPYSHQFFDSYPYDISPPTDDRPFFFQTTRLDRLKDGFEGLVWRAGPTAATLSPIIVLLAALVGLVIALSLGLAVPLLAAAPRLSLTVRSDVPLLGYFASLGLGFMLVEVVFLQRFTLLMGEPTYSLIVTLFTLLISSAAGSLLTWNVGPHMLGRALVLRTFLLVLLLVLDALFLASLVRSLVALSLAERWVVAVLLIAPAGLLMGSFMPIGLRALTLSRPQLVPWAWGVNGAASVLGSVIALSLGIFAGFSVVLTLAAATYAVVPLLFQRGLAGMKGLYSRI